jgi:hypothetical protein
MLKLAMRRFGFALRFLCVLCVSAVNLHAQGADPLKPFDFFVGGTWVAEGEFSGLGRYTAERTYRKILDGKFIEMEQVTKIGAQQSVVRGISGWHPERKAIVTWAFADDGSIAITECDCASAESFTFTGRLIGGMSAGPVRGNSRRTGPDSFVETVEAERNGAWLSHGQFEFKRRAAPMAAVNSSSTPVEALQPLARMVGLWVEEVRLTNARYTAEFEARWALGGKFLVSESRMLGTANAGLRALAFTGYDTDQKQLVQYSFSSDGSIFIARVSASNGVPEMVFDGDVIGPRPRTLRITYRRRDENTLTSNTELQYLGIYQPADNSVLRRKDRD